MINIKQMALTSLSLPIVPSNTMNQAEISAPMPRWLRWVWLVCGVLCMATAVVGIVLPLLPTTPFVLLAAYCFSRGSQRYEHWLLAHPRFGPVVRNWRENHAVPLGAKRLAWAMMAASSVLAWWLLPTRVGWIPGACCGVVALWMWQLPTAAQPTTQLPN
jgi:uncharacterized membrane protein YbaN (DUF454 family)